MSALLMDRGSSVTSLRSNNSSNRRSRLLASQEIHDNDANDIIKLQLKKPKSWNWELSTSKSSPNIAFPRILLYNEKGTLLADAQEADCVFNGSSDCRRTQSTKSARSLPSVSNRSSVPTTTTKSSSPASRTRRSRRSSTTNLAEINECLENLVGHLESNGINYKLRHHSVRSGSGGSNERKPKWQISTPSLNDSIKANVAGFLGDDFGIDSNTNDANEKTRSLGDSLRPEKLEKLGTNEPTDAADAVPEVPVLVYSERGILQRDLNAKEFNHLRKPYEKSKTTNLDNIQIPQVIPTKSVLKSNKSLTPVKEVRFDLHKSKSAIDMVEFDGSSGRERRFCRRTNSSGPSKFSGSILERMSAFKHQSSTESQDIQITTVEHGPRYFLRTSNAGTLVVCEESFRNRKVRRRPRSCIRISENDETLQKVGSHERIVQEFPYPALMKPSSAFSYYDEAIANIDNLISKVSSNRDDAINGGGGGGDCKYRPWNPKYRSTGDIRGEIKSQDMRANSMIAINEPNIAARNSNPNLLTVGGYIDSNREKSVASDCKVKRKKKVRQLRRCVSAGAVLRDLSSDEEDVQSNKRISRSRPKSRNESRDELQSRNVQPQSSGINSENGDQILTINNNLSAVQSIGSSADIIDEPTTDEVLLRLVQRLASIKKSQKDSANDQQSEKILSIEEDENQNYESQWTNNIENCDENHRPVQRQTTLLSHELLREEIRKDDSDDDTSDSSNEFISYTIESINGYDDSQQPKQSGSTLNLVINNNNSNNNNNYNNRDNENNSYERDDDFEEFVITNDQDDIQEEEEEFLLVDYNMGSNVSRNPGKGLTGRRTQSSGNLYSDKRQQQGGAATENGSNSNGIVANKANTLLPGQGTNLGNYDTTTGNQSTGINGQNVSETWPGKLKMSPQPQPPLCAARTNISVSRIDRNKFCGSLPNHLDDSDDVEKDTNVADNYNIVENSNTTDRIEYVTVVPRARGPQHQQQQFQQHHLGQQTTQQQQQHSPYNNSLSEKETASTSSGSSTFKINQDRPDIQLKLPLNRSNFDPSCDQGYGSERSPEDEFPPSMPNMTNLSYQAVSNPLELLDYNRCNVYTYDFITKDCTFAVKITKGPRGLGLSISGGIDSNAPFPGLIRIKRLFPHQAAWSTGQLEPGDIILEVNGIALTGLTNYEALEVLRTMPNEVVLLICRPDDEQYKKLSPPSEPPKPPERTQHQASTQTIEDELYPLQPLTPLQTNFTGEFEIIMVKQQGSLGFTLRKEDESVLGHYVRALVREPATTDGRIKPGDKIVAVNDVPLSAMTHEQAVIFLRQAADTVKLRLYRDGAQTPVAAMSPTNSENKTICGTAKKASLRPEAINLLSDLAYKKQTTGTPSANSTESSIKSTNSSPRRLKRGGNKTNNSEVNSQSEQDTTDSKSSSNPQYIVSSQTTSVCSDSEQSVVSQCSFIVQPADCGDNGLFKMPSPVGEDRPDRPSFLDLPGQIGSTPMVPRKPCFQFSVAANAYELNNLDNEALDAPIYTGANNGTTNSGNDEDQDRVAIDDTTIGLSSSSTLTGNQQLAGRHDFTSLPCETYLIACKTESDLRNDATNFSHRNPLHQSFHVQQNTDGSGNDTEDSVTKKDGNMSLLKWKGVVFSPEDDEVEKDTPEAESSCAATAGTNPTPATERDFDLKDFSSDSNGHKVITVELNRGWNSRLGFSLQPHPETRRAVISAIYSDSVAARDGRLRIGDQLLTVNDESVENTPTSELIDLMRIIRGSIVIKVLRKVDLH